MEQTTEDIQWSRVLILFSELTNSQDGADYNQQVELIRHAFNKITSTERHYHSMGYHIIPMMEYLKEISYRLWDIPTVEMYFWAILYHDVICDPKQIGGENERQSTVEWDRAIRLYLPEYERDVEVHDMIMATYGHESDVPFIREFLKMDLHGFTQSFDKILENELQVRKEYQFVDWTIYKEGRMKFCDDFMKNSIIKEMGCKDKLKFHKEYMMTVEPKIGLYVGSFFPFHVGHLDILIKAEAIFDKVIVMFAQNPEKPRKDFHDEMVPKILENHQVEFLEGSIVKWIGALEYPVTLIRGLRNSSDLIYEQNYLTWLDSTSSKPIQSVLIFSDPKLQHISSSAIRALAAVDEDKAEKYIFR